MTRADVVVVGGGPAAVAGGEHAAPRRRRRGRRRRRRPAPARPSFGQSAPPGTDRLVRDLIGPDAFDPTAHLRSLGNRSAWGTDELVLTDFMFNPFGTGWHLDRAAFDRRLLDVLAGVGRRRAARPRRRRRATHPGAIGSSRSTAPTGPRTIARASCATRRGVAQRSRARTARPRTRSTTSSRSRAVVERSRRRRRPHVDGGSRADRVVVHRARRRVAVVRSCTSPTPTSSIARSHGVGRRLRLRCAPPIMSPRSRRRRARADASSTPVVFAAGSRRLSSVVGDGWIAAGDAAVTFDPLSSQGILTALLTGREAGTTVARMLEPGTPTSRRRRNAPVRTRHCGNGSSATTSVNERTCFEAEDRFAHHPFWARRRARLAA